MLIRAMAREDEVEVLKSLHRGQCAYLSNSSLDSTSFENIRSQARSVFNEISNLLQPWAAASVEDRQKTEWHDSIDWYKKNVGDPADPEFQKKIAAHLASQKALLQRVKPMSQEEIIAGRLKEKRSRQARKRRR